jgi:ketosteroid isomerase-like protein
LCVLPLVALLAAGCSSRPTACGTPPDATAARRAIERTNVAFTDALRRGDVATAVATFMEDAVLLLPNLEPVQGRMHIQTLLAALIGGARDLRYTLATDDVQAYGDVAVERGHYTLSTMVGGKSAQDRGKYLIVWRRLTDGSWKIHRDISNTSLPPGAAAAR